jgi:hypothetical protein
LSLWYREIFLPLLLLQMLTLSAVRLLTPFLFPVLPRLVMLSLLFLVGIAFRCYRECWVISLVSPLSAARVALVHSVRRVSRSFWEGLCRVS